MTSKHFLLMAAVAFSSVLHAQIITVQNGANLFLGSGSQLYVDGLVLQPSADINITGPNSITKSTCY